MNTNSWLTLAVCCLAISNVAQILMWNSQLKINTHAGNLFKLLGERTGLRDREKE